MSETALEKILYRFLDAACLKHQKQSQFGKYIVDAYLPDYHLAFEADGQHWHSRARDDLRDKYLWNKFGLPVVRLTEDDLRDIERALLWQHEP